MVLNQFILQNYFTLLVNSTYIRIEKILNAKTIPTKTHAMIVVIFLFTNSPINFLFIVSTTVGITAIGINKLKNELTIYKYVQGIKP